MLWSCWKLEISASELFSSSVVSVTKLLPPCTSPCLSSTLHVEDTEICIWWAALHIFWFSFEPLNDRCSRWQHHDARSLFNINAVFWVSILVSFSTRWVRCFSLNSLETHTRVRTREGDVWMLQVLCRFGHVTFLWWNELTIICKTPTHWVYVRSTPSHALPEERSVQLKKENYNFGVWGWRKTYGELAKFRFEAKNARSTQQIISFFFLI